MDLSDTLLSLVSWHTFILRLPCRKQESWTNLEIINRHKKTFVCLVYYCANYWAVQLFACQSFSKHWGQKLFPATFLPTIWLQSVFVTACVSQLGNSSRQPWQSGKWGAKSWLSDNLTRWLTRSTHRTPGCSLCTGLEDETRDGRMRAESRDG